MSVLNQIFPPAAMEQEPPLFRCHDCQRFEPREESNMDSNGRTTIWGMQTAVHAPKPMKKTAKDSHCLEMLPDTCHLINRISPAGFAYISLATLDFSFIHLTAFFGQCTPYSRYICNNNKYLSYINFVHWCVISNDPLQPQTQWPSCCLPFSSTRHYDTKYICWIMLYYIIY